jgi:hypothetical protein
MHEKKAGRREERTSNKRRIAITTLKVSRECIYKLVVK